MTLPTSLSVTLKFFVSVVCATIEVNCASRLWKEVGKQAVLEGQLAATVFYASGPKTFAALATGA